MPFQLHYAEPYEIDCSDGALKEAQQRILYKTNDLKQKNKLCDQTKFVFLYFRWQNILIIIIFISLQVSPTYHQADPNSSTVNDSSRVLVC